MFKASLIDPSNHTYGYFIELVTKKLIFFLFFFYRSRPGFSWTASSKVRMALQSVAARLLPPLRPSTIILGICFNVLTACLLSQTCTKPTGAAMIPTGCILPLRTKSQISKSAVGALPTT